MANQDTREAPNNLREIRMAKKFTSRASLAVVSGVGEPTMAKIELHNWVPGYRVRADLASALGVEIADIWPTLGT